MRAARTVNRWTRAWGLTLLSIGSFHIFAAPAQQDTLTDRAEQGDDRQDRSPKHHHYKLIDTGTLGGPTSSLGFEGERDLNNSGVLVSLADTSVPDPYAPNCFLDCFLAQTVEWRNGVLTDLGALPVVNNSGPIWISDTGLISGLSQNGIDPLTGSPEFRAVLWKDGNLVDLGTFGGNNSCPGAVNDRGQVVGAAATMMSDPFPLCFGSQQTRAFLWQNGSKQDLGTLGGPDAIAQFINDRGQVAGVSFLDSNVNPSTGIPTEHPFLWEDGEIKDLGTIGGTVVSQLNHLNNRGEVVGGMTTKGDETTHPFLWNGRKILDLGTLGGNFGNAIWVNDPGEVVGWALTGNGQAHAFLWRRDTMTDLGLFEGDTCSIAYSLNSRTQIVGGSWSDDNCLTTTSRAFLWENSSLVDLNTLVSPGSGVQLTVAASINEGGEIAAQGVLPNGDLHAFLLIPCEKAEVGCEDAAGGTSASTRSIPSSATQATMTPGNPALSGRRGMLDRWRPRWSGPH
jgi:probable HAF family extracellular repeat protein